MRNIRRKPPILPLPDFVSKKTLPNHFGANAKMKPETVSKPMRTINGFAMRPTTH